jgi:putative inorganic carbon (hco3(-)) transporter
MNVTKNDLFYILMSIVVAAIGVLAVSNTNSNVGLYGLFGLVGIAVIMAIIIKPSVGANILVITVFTNISDLLTKQGFPGIMKPLVAVVAVGLLVRYLYTGQLSFWHPKTIRAELLLVAYWIVVTISFVVASDQTRALGEIVDLGKDIVIIYCIVSALQESRLWKQTTWLIIITTSLLCLLSFYQLVTNNYQQTFFRLADIQMDQALASTSTPRIAGPINDPNLWGQVLVAVAVLVMFRIIHEKNALVKLACVLMLGLILYIILNTYSRGAYLVVAINMLLILLLYRKRINPIVIFAGLTIVILLWPFIPVTFRDRFTSLFLVTEQNGVYQDTSLRGRSSEMLTGLAMFSEHPILGVGAANYNNNYQRYAQLIGIEFRAEARDPHSLYIQVLAETGILGTVAFFGMVFFLVNALGRAGQAIEKVQRLDEWLPWLNATRLAILSYMLTSVFLHNAYIRYFWILVALALAAIQITYNLLNRSERSTPLEARL